jgi:hypothetical protein
MPRCRSMSFLNSAAPIPAPANRRWRSRFAWTSLAKELDKEVRRVFDHAAAMLRSLASAAKIIEIIRDLYDEYLREHRVKSGLPAAPCPLQPTQC